MAMKRYSLLKLISVIQDSIFLFFGPVDISFFLGLYFCTQPYWIQIICKQIYLTLRSDPNRYYTRGQSGPGSNDNERVLHTTLELVSHYQMQFCVIPRTPHPTLFKGGSYPLYRGYSQCILCSTLVF